MEKEKGNEGTERKELSESEVKNLVSKIITVNKLFTLAISSMSFGGVEDTDSFMKKFIKYVGEESPQSLANALHTLVFLIKAISIGGAKNASATFLADVLMDGMDAAVKELCTECPHNEKCDHKGEAVQEKLFAAIENPELPADRKGLDELFAKLRNQDPELKDKLDELLRQTTKNMMN